MANSNALAVGLAVGIPSALIIGVVLIFWYKNQRKLRKEDLDDNFIERELQDDHSFKMFQDELHTTYDQKKGPELVDIQLKEQAVSDTSNGSSESGLENELQHQQQPEGSAHPYAQHLKLHQAARQLPFEQQQQQQPLRQPTQYYQQQQHQQQQQQQQQLPPHQRQISSYDFYNTFIPTFTSDNNNSNASSTLPPPAAPAAPAAPTAPTQVANDGTYSSSSRAHSSSDLAKGVANIFSSKNRLNSVNNTNNNNSTNNVHNLSDSTASSILLSSNNNNNNNNNNSNNSNSNNVSQPIHSRSTSNDLDTLAKQLNNSAFFEKLPSKAAAAAGNVNIKPRYPSVSNTMKNNSSSDLINNHLVGEDSAINDHFTYEAAMVEVSPKKTSKLNNEIKQEDNAKEVANNAKDQSLQIPKDE
ncbi:hypothetical protein LELG_04575 [Lodderomyces elongisporus NRRL YB-4239]|uniref:Suppressor of lethality of KEX2 GAS1 double null mutant protein 1 n=1 Tax=Lodderomyces elongisporus (strain ATCC 11503 / CBS 2605 / JCM 1781 / NBRC 1676 / NRRL YB-4239) TaxID=379508 RepID=A5E4N6_LODEL|nr:hypothetical protein LELG_04575 [Lodderomyces elongisporus NRRL YB-4239]